MKRSVHEPKFAWGGVDHDDVGSVAKILNSVEHGKIYDTAICSREMLTIITIKPCRDTSVLYSIDMCWVSGSQKTLRSMCRCRI